MHGSTGNFPRSSKMKIIMKNVMPEAQHPVYKILQG
jgi:hypothetical protein